MRTTTTRGERALRDKERLIARLRGLQADAKSLPGDQRLRRALGGMARELDEQIARLQRDVARARGAPAAPPAQAAEAAP